LELVNDLALSAQAGLPERDPFRSKRDFAASIRSVAALSENSAIFRAHASGGSAADEGIHPSNDRERPTEIAALDGGERSARTASEARLVLYGLAQEGLGEHYLPRYVPARKGVIESDVGGNKVPLGLGEAPAATRSPIGFLLEREEGFLGKIIYVAPHRFPP